MRLRSGTAVFLSDAAYTVIRDVIFSNLLNTSEIPHEHALQVFCLPNFPFMEKSKHSTPHILSSNVLEFCFSYRIQMLPGTSMVTTRILCPTTTAQIRIGKLCAELLKKDFIASLSIIIEPAFQCLRG